MIRQKPSQKQELAVALLLAMLYPCAPRIFVAQSNAQTPSADPPGTCNTEAAGKVPAKPEAGDDPDPELIALTWQYRPQANRQRIKQPVWRPDGARLTDVETVALLDEIESFQTHWWNPEQLPPLVMVFKRSPPIKSGLSTAVVLADGRRAWSGTWGPFQANRLAKSACAPQLTKLGRWPESVDIDVKVPLEDPQIIKTIQTIPDGPLEVAPGVRWYIDPDRGIEIQRGRARRQQLRAAVLEIENDSPESLAAYEATVWLRGKKQPLRGAYATIIEPRSGVRAALRVSDPLDGVNAIEKVDFTRQRFRIQRFKDIKLRVDLLLPLGK